MIPRKGDIGDDCTKGTQKSDWVREHLRVESSTSYFIHFIYFNNKYPSVSESCSNFHSRLGFLWLSSLSGGAVLT